MGLNPCNEYLVTRGGFLGLKKRILTEICSGTVLGYGQIRFSFTEKDFSPCLIEFTLYEQTYQIRYQSDGYHMGSRNVYLICEDSILAKITPGYLKNTQLAYNSEVLELQRNLFSNRQKVLCEGQLVAEIRPFFLKHRGVRVIALDSSIPLPILLFLGLIK